MKKVLPLLLLFCLGCKSGQKGSGSWSWSVGTQFNIDYTDKVDKATEEVEATRTLTFDSDAWRAIFWYLENKEEVEE